MSFDLTTIYHEGRPLSWSAISSFEWNKDQWYRKYVLKELPEITPELAFGSKVDKKIQDDKKFLPKLVRYPLMQHEMRTMYKDIPLLGFADTVSVDLLRLRDYKTGRKPWDQKRANETGQLTMYTAMMYLQHKIKPDQWQLFIDWLPTHVEEKKIAFIEPVKIHTFQTKRTMVEVLTFLQRIEDTWSAMAQYVERREGSELKEW